MCGGDLTTRVFLPRPPRTSLYNKQHELCVENDTHAVLFSTVCSSEVHKCRYGCVARARGRARAGLCIFFFIVGALFDPHVRLFMPKC